MKKNYNIENITDAFLALNDIDDEEVSGMIKSFKRVKPVKESIIKEGRDISLTSSSNYELEDALDYVHPEDENPEIEVIDANADAVEHVKNNKEYLGQALLCCNRCKSIKFVDMDDLVSDPENPNEFNVEDECPFCKQSGFGFELKGQVGKPEENNPEVPEEENNIEPLINDETSLENEDKEEVALDNDIEPEEVSEENPETEVEESEEEELEELPEEEESNPEDTEEHEDQIEDDAKKANEELENKEEEEQEEVSESFKSAVDLKEAVSENANEAWLMNKVVMGMNNEDAYYEDWIWLWPDGETREECEYDFSDDEAFNELKELFIDVYKKYHSDDLYDVDEETLEYAHKWDELLGLRPIKDLKIKIGEAVEEENKEEENNILTVKNLLDHFLEEEDLKKIEINNDFKGSFDELLEHKDLLEKEVVGFNTVDSSLVINVAKISPDEPEADYIKVVDLLNLFDNKDEKFDRIVLVDAEEFDSIYSGNLEGAIKAGKDLVVSVIEKPEILVIHTINNEDENNNKPLINNVEESLFEQICRENNLHSYKADRIGSEEYWLKEDLENCDDLQNVYKNYCRGKNCENRFREEFKDYEFVDDAEYKLKKLEESGFSKNQLDQLKELCDKLNMPDSLKAIEDYGKEHNCSNMADIISCMENELVEKEYNENPENLKEVKPQTHFVHRDEDGQIFVSVDGQHWEECSEEEFEEYLEGGYNLIECCNNKLTEENSEEELDESVKSFKTRKELKEAIEALENNNKPYSVRRSAKEGYRFDLVEEAEEQPVKAEEDKLDEVNALAKISHLAKTVVDSIKKYYDIDAMPALVVCDILKDLNLIDPDTEYAEVVLSDEHADLFEKIDGSIFDELDTAEEFIKKILEALDKPFEEISEEELDGVVEELNKENYLDANIDKLIRSDEFKNALENNQIEYVPENNIKPEVEKEEKIQPEAQPEEVEECINEETEKQICCICGKEFTGYGNSPEPVKDEGVCCDDCNMTIVVPARLEKAGYRKVNEELFDKEDENLFKETLDEKQKELFDKLTEEDKALLINAEDMGYWFDDIVGTDFENRYYELCDQLGINYSDKKVNEALSDEHDTTLTTIDDLYEDGTLKKLAEEVGTIQIEYEDFVCRGRHHDATEYDPEYYDEEICDYVFDHKVTDEDIIDFIQDSDSIEWFDDNTFDLESLGDAEYLRDVLPDYLRDVYEDEAKKECWEKKEIYNEEIIEPENESVELDTEVFDKFINEYFVKNYDDVLLYVTDEGMVNNKGVVKLSGYIQNEHLQKPVTFTFTPKQELKESLNTCEDVKKALKETNYMVTNDLSEEVMEFSFTPVNNTSNEEIFENEKDRALDILNRFIKTCKEGKKYLNAKEIIDAAAEWEYQEHRLDYDKAGLDTTHIVRLLLGVIDEFDFKPLIENSVPEEK